MNHFLKVPLLLSILFLVQTLKAQFVATTTANANLSPTTLIQNELAGYGVSVQNITTNIPLGANPDQFARFTNTNSVLPFSSGVMLSTGNADAYNNTGNTSTSTGTDLFGPSDISLASILAPASSRDAAVIEFDFIPSSDTIRLRYVFASEEYPEYVCTDSNDPFVIYLSGPGIVDTPNLALIPGTSLPVSINTVNPGVIGANGFSNKCEPPNGSLAYAQYYIDNTVSSNFQFDGLTTIFEIRAVVVPFATYHLKLAISDAWDGSFDSAIFFEANSFASGYMPGVYGALYQDFNQNCVHSANESTIVGIPYTIQPGNIVGSSNADGYYFIDSLAAGSYTMTVDTSNALWQSTCPASQTFTVVHPDSITQGPDFGLFSTAPCTQPNVSIVMPQMRRGMTGGIYVQACNDHTASNLMDSAYCIVELPPGLNFLSASVPYTAMGNNTFSFYLDTLYPGECVDILIQALVNLTNPANSTLCLEAQLYPQDSCIFDTTTYTPYSPSPVGSVSPCTTPWDRSSLMVEGTCVGDSVRFVIYNTGDPVNGDMSCFAPVRVYVDGQFYLLDSIQLAGGDSTVFMFEGNGSTWILQADQHPFHPGNSNPNAHVENCGTGTGNGTGVVIQFPNDDADPVVDIFCGQVTAPLDPNDKTGFPGGLTSMHHIQQNQQLEYLIRFQNVGTDTAVNVVIQDTLSNDLDINSVVSEVASHAYELRVYDGQRILEWTFRNIMLPDSFVNEPASNGFVKFKVNQLPDLPFGTVIENTAAIYFDYEAPVITNTYFHTIYDFSFVVTKEESLSIDGFEAVLIPNPVSDDAMLHLSGLKDYNNIDIQLFDMTGRQVQALYNQGSDKIPLKVHDLTKGVYVLRVLQEGRSVGVLKMVVR